jgi:hypothetical protein
MTILMVGVMIAWAPGVAVASVGDCPDGDLAATSQSHGGSAPAGVLEQPRSPAAVDRQDHCNAVGDQERIRVTEGFEEPSQVGAARPLAVSEAFERTAREVRQSDDGPRVHVSTRTVTITHSAGEAEPRWSSDVHPAVPTGTPGAVEPPVAERAADPTGSQGAGGTTASSDTAESGDTAGNSQSASRTNRGSSSQSQSGSDNDQRQRRERSQTHSQSQTGSNNHQIQHQSTDQHQEQRQSGSDNDQSQSQSVTQSERQSQG